jgi:site-specific DNA-methyltransferase (adenine-specific)
MKPYYEQDGITIYHGDCRDVMPNLDRCDVAIVDPPYGETSLAWDRPVEDWQIDLPTDQMWCFGSLRSFLANRLPDWSLIQDVVWEKHNGSNFNADRFRRVHELVTHWRRSHVKWKELYHEPQTTADATRRSICRKEPPPQTGKIKSSTYTSVDGGPRLMRSVLQVRSCHGEAVHPTQKPLGILSPLIRYSCPPGGLVLDPFCGSGSALEAARLSGCRAIGIEVDEEFCEVAARRLAQGVLSLN